MRSLQANKFALLEKARVHLCVIALCSKESWLSANCTPRRSFFNVGINVNKQNSVINHNGIDTHYIWESVRFIASESYAGKRFAPPPPPPSSNVNTKTNSSKLKKSLPPPPPSLSSSFKLPPPPPLTGALAYTSTVTDLPWRTAHEVLSYFIEYVPTFYVPLNSVAAMLPDDIRSLFLGRNKFFIFIRRYPFFFDLRQKDAGSRWDVKLNDDVNHPKRGVGDDKFMIIDVGERTNYVARPEFVVSTENIDSASLNVCITPQEVPPAMRVELEERVPVLERLKSLVPVEFTAVDEVEHDLPEDILYHPYFDCQGGLTAIANKFPEHFQLVDNKIRLRRAHLAPLALDEFTLDNSPLPEVAALLKKEVCDSEIPHWVRLTPLYEHLTKPQRQEIKRTFRSFAGFVRAHGRSLSISLDMLQVAMWITSAQAPDERTSSSSAEVTRQECCATNSTNETMMESYSASVSASASVINNFNMNAVDVNNKSSSNNINGSNLNSSGSCKEENISKRTVTNDNDAGSKEQEKVNQVNNNINAKSENSIWCNANFSLDTKNERERRMQSNLNVFDSAIHKTYSATEIVNELFDRFPYARSLTLAEALKILPEKMQSVCSTTKINYWLKDFKLYFEVENPTERDADAIRIHRTSDRQPLDVAMILYEHLPTDGTAMEEAKLLSLLSESQRKIITHIGVTSLPELLPQWIAVTEAHDEKSKSCERLVRALRSIDDLERQIGKMEVEELYNLMLKEKK